MKKAILIALGTVALALLAIFGGLAATSTADEAPEPVLGPESSGALTNLAPLVADQLEMRVRWGGRYPKPEDIRSTTPLSSAHSPNTVVGTEDGRVLATFLWRSGWSLREIIITYAGEPVGDPIEVPFLKGQGFIYEVKVLVDALGQFDVSVVEPVKRQIWWKGQKLGYGPLTSGYFEPDICEGLTHTYIVTDEGTELVCGTTYYGGTDGPE